MKKLYKKGTVHPTPPLLPDQLLSFLPATILTLTVALSPEDKEVLAYLISCSSSTNFSNNHRKATAAAGTTSSGGAKGDADHPTSFNCYCFRCYMSYWAKWDSSPNRELIHEVIDAFEDSLLMQNKKDKSKRERRKGKSGRGSSQGSEELKKSELSLIKNDFVESNSASEGTSAGGAETGDVEEEDDRTEEELEKGSVGKFVSFLGEKIWGVWS
ncbi:uncharacterized protein LOC111370646 [Olea europaea var. sylvestris]|uniref:Uncharacterized protein n=1 Tax=Olea europaea subsp. europaea TaxID=158383 RepID=A0A8S0PMN6_OLEEU|nr:uncharacterized protein LOC111370646 [Olea europaea var. sylvestris]CAA2955046.1 Hypothetical predicted protein [Olea europaea subsp. europaea]